ncbi:MAG: MarR family transcriptional regulator [Clostridiaceae bacterium]|jgi:MarR family transcriptional regulator, organic hydroperoxide resistance regulator|nr:MarR family transcriptional regulator [Clostridiaceae bacterium]
MIKDLFKCCLYFTANSLARIMTSFAEDEFKKTGLSPNYAFIVMLVCENPKISQKEVGEYLQLTPSTITRFVDKIEQKGFVKRLIDGKSVLLIPTDDGKKLLKEIKAAWKRLHDRYSKILGDKKGEDLTRQVGEAALKLEGK